MNKVNIQFGGMSNIPDDSVSRDGSMAVLLNAEIKNGEVVPVMADKEIRQGGASPKKAVFHNGRFLEISQTGELAWSKSVEDTPTALQFGLTVDNFEVVGNIVVMYGKENKTNKENVFYAIWDEGKENYRFLGELPEVPEMVVETGLITESTSFFSDISKEGLFGQFEKTLNQIYEKTGYVDNALFVVGLRFFDGSYKYSHIYFVRNEEKKEYVSWELSRDNNFIVTLGHSNDSVAATHIAGFSAQFKFDYDLSGWKDIISSVDVFTSGSIMERWAVDNCYSVKPVPTLRKEIEECPAFFRVASFDLEGNMLSYVKNTSPTNLAVQELLPFERIKKHTAKESFVYNARLHSWGGYEIPDFATDNTLWKPQTENFIYDGDFATSVEFKNKEVRQYRIRKRPNETYLSSLISQPIMDIERQLIDFGDSGMNIMFKNNPYLNMSVALNGTYEYDMNIDFKISGDRLYAFYNENPSGLVSVKFDGPTFYSKMLADGYVATNYRITFERDSFGEVAPIMVSCEGKRVDYQMEDALQLGVIVENFPKFFQIEVTVTPGNTIYDIAQFEYGPRLEVKDEYRVPDNTSTIKVSDVDNPFYFPTAQTYKFDGDIVGLASNAEAVSPGQFGQFPLYVFTTEGIWALQVDTSGKGAYLTSTPISRERCNGSVCPFSGGIAFTTDKGVMAISGGVITELSEALDGPPQEMFEFTEENDVLTKIFQKGSYPASYVKNMKPIPIREFIKGAALGYDYNENRLVLFRSDYLYAYVYCLKSQTWMMKRGNYGVKVKNLGPKGELVFLRSGRRDVFAAERIALPVIAVTRPIKVDTLEFKRLRQAALRCTFVGGLNFYILGSNDGANFVCITGKEYPSKNGNESMNVKRRDLITSMARSKQYKYIAIAFVGNIEGRVSFAELLVDAGFANNQLR